MNINNSYTEFAEVYDLMVNLEEYEDYIKLIVKELKKRFSDLKTATLADIGGGTGLVTYQIYHQVQKTILVEPSETMFGIAKKKYNEKIHSNIDFRHGGLPNCGLEKDSIDIVIAVYNPFQYILTRDEQLLALKDIFQCLKSGGLIFLDMKNFFSLIRDYKAPEPIQIDLKDKRIICLIKHENYPEMERWIHTYNILFEDLNSGILKKIISKHVLKMISPNEMFLLLERSNFAEIEITYPPISEEETPTRIWCFARKP
jgi:ubiquinone/menaquinone biosynthesis C-methylase UbiE